MPPPGSLGRALGDQQIGGASCEALPPPVHARLGARHSIRPCWCVCARARGSPGACADPPRHTAGAIVCRAGGCHGCRTGNRRLRLGGNGGGPRPGDARACPLGSGCARPAVFLAHHPATLSPRGPATVPGPWATARPLWPGRLPAPPPYQFGIVAATPGHRPCPFTQAMQRDTRTPCSGRGCNRCLR